ncbi:basic salivary proline-rich protein 2-like [Poecile atricapillus]|uniref:basic salivary proline-rich protein 2-like n=1 Tax=Poecile atricapillus TaxID=48891 RepID=UPI0027388E8A|nr:basic salivary proline-rich protein 2-like [Poecile atricapillus]
MAPPPPRPRRGTRHRPAAHSRSPRGPGATGSLGVPHAREHSEPPTLSSRPIPVVAPRSPPGTETPARWAASPTALPHGGMGIPPPDSPARSPPQPQVNSGRIPAPWGSQRVPLPGQGTRSPPHPGRAVRGSGGMGGREPGGGAAAFAAAGAFEMQPPPPTAHLAGVWPRHKWRPRSEQGIPGGCGSCGRGWRDPLTAAGPWHWRLHACGGSGYPGPPGTPQHPVPAARRDVRPRVGKYPELPVFGATAAPQDGGFCGGGTRQQPQLQHNHPLTRSIPRRHVRPRRLRHLPAPCGEDKSRVRGIRANTAVPGTPPCEGPRSLPP